MTAADSFLDGLHYLIPLDKKNTHKASLSLCIAHTIVLLIVVGSTPNTGFSMITRHWYLNINR